MTQNKDQYYCKHCGRSFDTPRGLAGHKGSEHKDKLYADADDFSEAEVKEIKKAAGNPSRRLVALDADTVKHAERYTTLTGKQLNLTTTDAFTTAARYGFLNHEEAFGFTQMVDMDDPTRDAQEIVDAAIKGELRGGEE